MSKDLDMLQNLQKLAREMRYDGDLASSVSYSVFNEEGRDEDVSAMADYLLGIINDKLGWEKKGD